MLLNNMYFPLKTGGNGGDKLLFSGCTVVSKESKNPTTFPWKLEDFDKYRTIRITFSNATYATYGSNHSYEFNSDQMSHFKNNSYDLFQHFQMPAYSQIGLQSCYMYFKYDATNEQITVYSSSPQKITFSISSDNTVTTAGSLSADFAIVEVVAVAKGV